jgi:hypothetical protein
MNSSKPVESSQSQPGTRPLNIADIGMRYDGLRYDGMIGVRFDDAKAAKPGPHWTVEIELESTDESLVNQLLAGTFNENIQSHAENLAERLIQRQQELDRRESQLNRFAADIENRQRQVRMHQAQPDSKPEPHGETALSSENSPAPLPLQEADSADEQSQKSELESGVDSVQESDEQLSLLQHVDNETLLHRIDRYHAAETRTSAIVHKRLKKLARNAKQEKVIARMQRAIVDGSQPDLPWDTAQVAIPFPKTDSSSTPPWQPQPSSSKNIIARPKSQLQQPHPPQLSQLPVNFSISELTKRISAVRKRSEEVDRMYDDLTLIFTETLRQQSKLRAIVDEVQAGGRRVTVATLTDARLQLDRLTVQLTRVGREHFLLPPGTEAA